MIDRHPLPYPGLRAFRADENILFFGREGCVDEMLDTLVTTRFLAVLGSSGSGKSSLVRTGLLDAVQNGAIVDAGDDWVIADFHPGANPMRALAGALVKSGNANQIDALQSLLGTWPGALVEWAQFGNVKPGGSILLLVDQFEELFRYSDYMGQQAAEAFIALLHHSAANTDVPIYVVLTMRSEYLGNCALIPGLAERINQGLYLTPRMDRQSCREAIEGPANLFGFSIEPKLVNQILNDMASFAPFEHGGEVGPTNLSRRADQLPLMQHLLNRLWTRAEAAGQKPLTLTYADYREVGGLEGALAVHGQSIIDDLATEHRRAVPTVFRALVAGRDAASAVRRAVPFAALEEEAGSSARAVVEAFRARSCNFLRPEADVPLEPDTLVDISHESLIRQWGLLTEWTKAEADDGATWQRLVDREVRWRAEEGGLLTGRDLAALSQWWDDEPPTPEWAERHGGNFAAVSGYLADSRAAEASARDAEQRREVRDRRRWITASGVLGVILAACVGLLFMLFSNGVTLAGLEDKTAKAEQKLAEANAKLADAETTLKQSKADRNDLERDLNARIATANLELDASEGEIAKSKLIVDQSKRLIAENQSKIVAAEASLRAAEVEAKQQSDIARRQRLDIERRNRDDSAIRRTFEYCNSRAGGGENACRILLNLGGSITGQ